MKMHKCFISLSKVDRFNQSKIKTSSGPLYTYLPLHITRENALSLWYLSVYLYVTYLTYLSFALHWNVTVSVTGIHG